MNRHVDPMSVGILDSVVGILVGFRIDLGIKTRFLQSALDLLKIIDFKAKVVDAFLLVFAFDLSARC